MAPTHEQHLEADWLDDTDPMFILERVAAMPVTITERHESPLATLRLPPRLLEDAHLLPLSW